MTPDDVIELLKKKMEKEKVSENRLSKQIGCSQSHVNRIMRGVQPPGPTVLKFLGLEAVKVIRRV